MIYLGADHGGFELKEKLKNWLTEWGYQYQDLGAETLDSSDDYVVFAKEVGQKVAAETNSSISWKDQSKGVLLCRSGGGMVIAANRFPKVRAVYVDSVKAAEHSRKDNDANVISLAGDWISDQEAKESIKTWLETEFSGEERHLRRIQMIDAESRKS